MNLAGASPPPGTQFLASADDAGTGHGFDVLKASGACPYRFKYLPFAHIGTIAGHFVERGFQNVFRKSRFHASLPILDHNLKCLPVE